MQKPRQPQLPILRNKDTAKNPICTHIYITIEFEYGRFYKKRVFNFVERGAKKENFM